MSQLKQRVVASYHLYPLNRDETENYINFRLKRVASSTLPEFSMEALDSIYQYTNGIPRIINTFCNRILLYGSLEGIHVFDKIHINNVIDEITQESILPESQVNEYDMETDTASNNRINIIEDKIAGLERQLQFMRDIIIKLLKLKKNT